MYKFLLTCCLIFSVFAGTAQTHAELVRKLRDSKADTNRIKALIGLGKYNLFKPGDIKTDIDSAKSYFGRAKQLCVKLGETKLEYQCNKYLANAYIESGDLNKGYELFLQIISYYQEIKSERQEADTWRLMGDLFYNNGKDDHKAERIKFYKNANRLYFKVNDQESYFFIMGKIAENYITSADTSQGKKIFLNMIRRCQLSNENLKEAETWRHMADAFGYSYQNMLSYRATCFLNAYRLYLKCNKPDDAGDALKNAAITHVNCGEYDLAEKEYLQTIELFRAKGVKKVHQVYLLLGNLYLQTKQSNKELECRLKAIQYTPPEDPERAKYFSSASGTYRFWGMPEKGDYWMRKAIDYSIEHHDEKAYIFYLEIMVGYMVGDKKPKEALALLINKVKAVHAPADREKMVIADAFGGCYVALGQYDRARPFIDTLQKLFFKLDVSRGREGTVNWPYYYFKIIKFYVVDGQYEKASNLLKQVDALPAGAVNPIYHSLFEMAHFKIDSAGMQYFSAIKHFQQYKAIADSIFSAEKVKKIKELELKYEAGKKDRSIAVLQNQSLAQEGRVQKANALRNITFIGITMSFIAVGFFYNSYRQKQRSNNQLQIKQAEINSQNQVLQDILHEKDGLLIEKEWLLKEVHHRVKNNLQIVMSLLSTQSAFLKNHAALEAITESRNRVRVISLLHQKLYSSKNMATVVLSGYIADLIANLQECFNTAKQGICFELDIEQIELDLTQAVPLGLILNESITNAIKYAFGPMKGVIKISLRYIGHDTILLTITDNGIGMPVDFVLENACTLGMEMMKALSKQLGGEFSVNGSNGVAINVQFERQVLTQAYALKAV